MRLGLGNSLIDSSVVGVSAEAQQFLDRLPILPSSSLEGHYATFIDGLVAAGIFDAFDALYLFSVETPSASCVNLVQDRFPLDLNIQAGSCEFTPNTPIPANAGWQTDNNLAHMLVYENLLSASGMELTQNDAAIFSWGVASGALSGVFSVRAVAEDLTTLTDTLSLYPRFADDTMGALMNATLEVDAANTDGSGLFLGQRTSSTSHEVYKGTTLKDQNVRASVALPNGYIVCVPRRLERAFGFGRSLSTQERTDLYDLLSAFITATAGVVP